MNKLEQIFLKELYGIITLLLILTLLVSVLRYTKYRAATKKAKQLLLLFFSIWIALLFGYRDYNVGVDTFNYIDIFKSKILPLESFRVERDFFWDFFNYLYAQFSSDPRGIFVLVALGYVLLPIYGVKNHLEDNTIFFFLLFVISPNFFLFGANTIRSGLAASLLLFSLAYYGHKKQLLFMIMASLIHLSMLVPVVFMCLAKFVKSLRYPLLLWCILLAISFSGVNLLSYLPFSISRLQEYVVNDVVSGQVWVTMAKFLAYSISPILLGIYVVGIKKTGDKLYRELLICYIFSNCLYIIAFNSIFAVRFAYLSEFLMPFLLTYPILKFKLWKYGEVKLVIVLLVVFLLKAYKIFVL